MRLKSIVLISAVVLVLLSCADNREQELDIAPFAKELLKNTDSPGYAILANSRELNPAADIALLATSYESDNFSRRFSNYDLRDNVTASLGPDELMDFSGETVSCIVDDGVLIDASDSLSVANYREYNLHKLLCAVDTLAYVSPYDMEGLADKQSSKILILASPQLVHYSQTDFEYLISNSGSSVQLISPLELGFDQAFSLKAGKAVNIGVICNEKQDPNIYIEYFKAKALEASALGSKCVVMPATRTDSLVYKLLDKYAALSNGKQLDAIIIDDYSLNPDELKLELAGIVSILNESSMTYGTMLSDDFRMFDCFELGAESAYALLRKNNLFTHNISQPLSNNYSPVSRTTDQGESLILIPATYVQN